MLATFLFVITQNTACMLATQYVMLSRTERVELEAK
jgi:hypothetical protein